MSTYTPNKFVKDRLELFDVIFKKGFDLKTGKLWILEPSHLRFRLGESIKDLKIPYIFGGDDETAIEKSILTLTTFLKQRFEPGTPINIKDNLPSPIDAKTGLIEKTYRTDFFLPDSPERNIARDILTTTPLMDSGILKAWLAPNGYGKAYYILVKGIISKAMLEEIRLERMERTSFLAIIAIINITRKKKEDIIRTTKIKGLSYERLDQIVALAHYFAFKAAAKAVAYELKQMLKSYGLPESEGLFEEYFTPRSFFTIQGNIINSDLNPYGIQENVVSSLKTFYENAVSTGNSLSDIIAIVENGARRNTSLAKEFFGLSTINAARQLIGDYLLDYDIAGIDVHNWLAELYLDNRLIHALFTDSKAASKLEEGFNEIRQKFPKDVGRLEKIAEIMEFVNSAKKSSISDWLGISKKKDEAIADIIGGFIAYKFDEEMERFISSMREMMIDRRGEFSGEILKMEYDRGRIYRFSTDERAILKELEVEAEAHLFVDMKDFTRKTFRSKEIAMADFMESNFYKPILSAASRYGSSLSGLADNKKSIKLNNLLGDAVVFSGGVSNLIALAGDIRQIMKRYKEQLERKVPHIMEEELIRNIHKNFEAMKEDIVKELTEVDQAITMGKKGLEAKVMELKEKEHRLEKAYSEELEAAIGQEMEAGLFITYGSKAEIIAMRDSLWGEVTVAIGEKINEAARGTSRSYIVRAKIERLLEEERLRRHNPNLSCPFDVHISKTYGFMMPSSLDDRLEEIVARKDVSKARDLAQMLAQEFYKDLGRVASGETLSSLRVLSTTSDIYNKGQALSEEALKAYIKESKGRSFFFRREVQVSELDREIQNNFFFPFRKQLELWFGVFITEGIKGVEIFCKVGEVIFKGFEAATPTVVYEIINKNSEFSKLLVKHHFDKWYEEAQKMK